MDGELVTAGASNGEEYPKPTELVDILANRFAEEARAGTIRASCICFDGLWRPDATSEKRDAFICEMEHRDWTAMSIAAPYRILDDGKIEIGKTSASQLEAKVFPEMNSGKAN